MITEKGYDNEIRFEDPKALEKILNKRQVLIEQHNKMIQGNKAHIILRAAFSNDEIVELAQRMVQNDGKPYTDEDIWRNKAARQRIGRRLEILKKRQSIVSKKHEFNGGSVFFNSRKNKVQISFDLSPNFKLENMLYEHGFQYFARTKTWDRRLSEEAWESALKIVNERF